MDYSEISTQINSKISISNLLAFESREEIIQEIFTGLSAKQRKISSRFFYDDAGSLLFEKITELPEYYPTRTEKSILREIAPLIMNSPKDIDIIELGSGDCSKISILLDAVPEKFLQEISYFPLDVSEAAILKSAKSLMLKYPEIRIHGLLADFMKQLDELPGNGNRLIFFFGSTLGNLTRDQADRFLTDLKSLMRTGDRLILGLDMVKDLKVLDAAYNDQQGVTEAFNKNILNVVNEIAGTDFNPDLFEHIAFYNSDMAQIEMHLRVLSDMVIHSPEFPQKITLRKGDTIHTENSHKFVNQDIDRFGTITGLEIENIFTDSNKWFSIVAFKCVD